MEFHDVSMLLMGLSHPILYLKDMKVGFHLEKLLPVMHHGPRLAGAAFHGWVQRFGTSGALCVLPGESWYFLKLGYPKHIDFPNMTNF